MAREPSEASTPGGKRDAAAVGFVNFDFVAGGRRQRRGQRGVGAEQRRRVFLPFFLVL